MDFSHANAYDTLIRPVQSIINQVAAGEKDNDGMMDDFILGSFVAMRELGEPFISESIWTEAVLDIIARKGRTRSGSEVYNDKDLPGVKARKIMDHLVEAQMPFSLNQLKRIDKSIEAVDVITKGKYDDYGQDYEFGPEFAGLFGFRAIELNPERSIQFKVADYQDGVRNSRKLFTSNVLKGGPVEPYEIIDAYINANRALFSTRKEMVKDLEAAKILGMSNVDIAVATKGRLTKRDLGSLQIKFFKPYKLSDGIFAKFQENADKINVKNPVYDALGEINSILSQLSGLDLDDEFPFIENKLLPKPGGADAASLPTGVNTAPIDANILSSQVQQTDSTNAQRFATLFPNG